jgi:hypothetical protein
VESDPESTFSGTAGPVSALAGAVARGSAGAATIAALTASEALLRLRRERRPISAKRRR